jgi:hypothetical protein
VRCNVFFLNRAMPYNLYLVMLCSCQLNMKCYTYAFNISAHLVRYEREMWSLNKKEEKKNTDI